MNNPPISNAKKYIATVTVSVGTLLISLDQFVANVALPNIAGDLGVSLDDGTWVITSYVIANAITIPLTGWLTSLVGRVRLFSISAILFALMSLLCGLSFTFPMLITFRILQGLVSGSLIPLSQALLLMLYPGKKNLAMGIWGLVVMVGPALGPVVGGWITDNYNWTWIFNINVPLGLFAGVLSYFLLSSFESPRVKKSIDVIGIFLLVLSIGAYQIMLDRGNDDDWFHSPFIVTLAIVAFVGFVFFIIWEIFHWHPVVELSFFKNWNFTLGSLIIGFSMWIVFGSVVVGPNWVQAQLGYTPLWAGYSIAPFGLSALFVFPIVGNYLHLMHIRLWIGIGFLFMIFSFFYMAYLSIWTPFANLAWPRFFQGIGFAFFYVPLTVISLAKIPEHRMPSAAGLFSFVRLIFISMGITLNTTYFSRRQNFFQSRYVESVIPANPQFFPYVEALNERLGLSGKHAEAFIYKMVINQAYTETFLELCYLWACGFILLFGLLFLLRSDKRTEEVSELRRSVSIE